MKLCYIVIDKCRGVPFSTEMWCPSNDRKEMWTFNEKQKKCEAVRMDTCNSHFGNIFEKEIDCKTLCVSN